MEFPGLEPGITSEASLASMSHEAQKFREVLLSSPEGERVPDEAVQKEAAEIEAFVRNLRDAERKKVRRTLLEGLIATNLYVAVAAMVSLAPRATEALQDTKAGKLAMDEMSLKDVAAWEDRPKLEGLPSYEVMRRELAEAFGEEALEEEIPVHTEDYIDFIRKMRAEQERAKEPLAVEGFQEKFGIPDEAIQQIISETVPSGWSGAGTVSSFTISQKPMPLSKESGLSGNADGRCRSGEWEKAAELLVSPDYRLSDKTPALINHELAHANDWNRSNVLSPEDRLTLLYLVHERMSSPDHLRFSYVESISNPDKKAEHLKKCTEYWAELMGYSLDIPAESKEEWERKFRAKAVEKWAHPQAHPSPDAYGAKDLRIVNWYVGKVDPSFKPWEASKDRQELIDRTMREVISTEVEELVADVPSASMRTMFTQMLQGDHRHEALRAYGSVTEDELSELPESVRSYLEDFDDARRAEESEFVRNIPERLDTVFFAYARLHLNLELIRDRTNILGRIRGSDELNEMQEQVGLLNEGFRGLGNADIAEVERLAQEYDRIQRGNIHFDKEPPKKILAMLER